MTAYWVRRPSRAWLAVRQCNAPLMGLHMQSGDRGQKMPGWPALRVKACGQYGNVNTACERMCAPYTISLTHLGTIWKSPGGISYRAAQRVHVGFISGWVRVSGHGPKHLGRRGGRPSKRPCPAVLQCFSRCDYGVHASLMAYQMNVIAVLMMFSLTRHDSSWSRDFRTRLVHRVSARQTELSRYRHLDFEIASSATCSNHCRRCLNPPPSVFA